MLSSGNARIASTAVISLPYMLSEILKHKDIHYVFTKKHI
jgi:hypothetical protein